MTMLMLAHMMGDHVGVVPHAGDSDDAVTQAVNRVGVILRTEYRLCFCFPTCSWPS